MPSGMPVNQSLLRSLWPWSRGDARAEEAEGEEASCPDVPLSGRRRELPAGAADYVQSMTA